MRAVKEKCGCSYEKNESQAWVQLCPAAESAYQATRTRWLRERATGTSEEPGPAELDRCPR